MSRHIRGTLFSRDVISHDTCAIVPIQRTRSTRASAPRMALGPTHPFRLLTSRKNHGYRVSKLLPTGRRLFYRWCLHPPDTITASLESVNSDTMHDDAIPTHTTPTRHLRTDRPSTTLVQVSAFLHNLWAIVGHSSGVDLCCVFYSRAASRQTRPIDFARTFGVVFGLRCVCKSLRRESY